LNEIWLLGRFISAGVLFQKKFSLAGKNLVYFLSTSSRFDEFLKKNFRRPFDFAGNFREWRVEAKVGADRRATIPLPQNCPGAKALIGTFSPKNV
jgi:hypothetical protein